MKIVKALAIVFLGFFLSCKQQSPTPKTPISDSKSTLSPDERFGQLFVDVQMAQVFPDGKTFVDCVPLFPTDSILAAYEANKNQPEFHLKAFVLQYFKTPTSYDLANDFKSDLSRSPEEHINALWDVLTRPRDTATRSSLLPLPNPYIVPGGRFREVYYWDSYFTMLGLQASNRSDLIEHIIDNFAYLLDTIGFIPNGNRTYYLGRSQPPFFAAMVGVLAEMKGEEIYTKYLPQLRKEYDFWMDSVVFDSIQGAHRRFVKLKDGVLNRYCDDKDTPRPESYREDVETAAKSGRPKAEMYRHLRSGAESGWDFSSRWFRDGKNITTIHTTDIIPVDLNALLYHLEKTLEKAYTLNKDSNNAKLFAEKAAQRKVALIRYCWNAKAGFFEDYDFVAGKQTGVLSLAGVYPLFFGIADQQQAAAVAKVLQRDFLKPGGVVSTRTNTGQQWDAPNGWAPLQWITIQGLRNYQQHDLANTIKRNWVNLNTKIYKNTGKMVEKYNVMDITLEAGGGEYALQDGFGWTNGVLLKLLTEKEK